MTTQQEINEANRKSALEQVAQDERNDELKADMNAVAFVNGHSPRHKFTFIGDIDRRAEALQEIERENVEASRWTDHQE